MIIDVALVAGLIYLPLATGSVRYAAWIVVALALRRVPWFAGELASWLGLDPTYHTGGTLWLADLLLPAWRSRDSVMSRSNGSNDKKAAEADTCINTRIADTGAIPPADRDITLDQWLVAMALARDEHGKELFSATKIAAAIGGAHNPTMARIKEVRTGLAPQYRSENGGIEGATYPVTKS